MLRVDSVRVAIFADNLASFNDFMDGIQTLFKNFNYKIWFLKTDTGIASNNETIAKAYKYRAIIYKHSITDYLKFYDYFVLLEVAPNVYVKAYKPIKFQHITLEWYGLFQYDNLGAFNYFKEFLAFNEGYRFKLKKLDICYDVNQTFDEVALFLLPIWIEKKNKKRKNKLVLDTKKDKGIIFINQKAKVKKRKIEMYVYKKANKTRFEMSFKLSDVFCFSSFEGFNYLAEKYKKRFLNFFKGLI